MRSIAIVNLLELAGEHQFDSGMLFIVEKSGPGIHIFGLYDVVNLAVEVTSESMSYRAKRIETRTQGVYQESGFSWLKIPEHAKAIVSGSGQRGEIAWIFSQSEILAAQLALKQIEMARYWDLLTASDAYTALRQLFSELGVSTDMIDELIQACI